MLIPVVIINGYNFGMNPIIFKMVMMIGVLQVKFIYPLPPNRTYVLKPKCTVVVQQ